MAKDQKKQTMALALQQYTSAKILAAKIAPNHGIAVSPSLLSFELEAPQKWCRVLFLTLKRLLSLAIHRSAVC